MWLALYIAARLIAFVLIFVFLFEATSRGRSGRGGAFGYALGAVGFVLISGFRAII